MGQRNAKDRLVYGRLRYPQIVGIFNGEETLLFSFKKKKIRKRKKLVRTRYSKVAGRTCDGNYHTGSIPPPYAETILLILDTKVVLGSIQPR